MSDAVPPLECWLPALKRFDPAHPLQRLLAEAERQADGPRGYLAGLAGYVDVGDSPLPAAALTRELLAGDAGDALWLCADPAWVQPDMNGARLLACGQMPLSADEAGALAETLQPVFAEASMDLRISTPESWHLRLPDAVALPDFAAPEQALGEDLFPHLPQGPEGRRWRVLINEVQVLLHQHPVNAERAARGEPPVNSLWLWGAGRLPARAHSDFVGIVSDDLLLNALAARAGLARRPRSAEQVAMAGTGWLVDLQDMPVAQIEREGWPTLQALARRQPVRLAFASGERWLHRPWHRWRFWRGKQP